jgi:small subunit ribosomal protein S9
MTNLHNKKFIGIGRRKTAVAIVKLISNEEEVLHETKFLINNKVSDEYLQHNLNYINKLRFPFIKLQLLHKYQVNACVKGGGLSSQVDAITLGLSRALCKLDNINFRPSLKIAGLLSRDARIKERRKYGLKKARKASQSSKR